MQRQGCERPDGVLVLAAMKPNDRIPAKLAPDISIFDRVTAMLGHYDFRIYVSDGAYLDVGGGSLGILGHVIQYPTNRHGLVGTVGRYCDFNETAKIIAHGEHNNDRIVNVTFAGLPVLQGRNAGAEAPFRPFTIGNAVVASYGALVLSGRSVGDGVVLGASAVVTKDLDAHGVYAGVPARRLRDRPSGAPWWDFDVAYLRSNLGDIERLAADRSGRHVYRRATPRIALKTWGQLEIMGAVQDGRVVGFSQMPAQVREYITQAMTAEEPYWMADCWP